MELTLRAFGQIVKDASESKLLLPQFQRKWVWKRADVLRLFDSLRKGYPIGGILLLKPSNEINLAPRRFTYAEGLGREYDSTGSRDPFDAYVLDGQQRITAGLALYQGLGSFHYFLNLQALWERVEQENINLDDQDSLRGFSTRLDETDGYLDRRRWSPNSDSLIDSHHLLWTKHLTDEVDFSNTRHRYVSSNPERQKFMERFIAPYFKIEHSPLVPVTILDSDMSVEAITRVFHTLNVSGEQLSPFEIVVAILFAQDIHLRKDIEDYQEIADYYRNMDPIGEIFLQTIALKDRRNPKKTMLPRTITRDNYYQFNNEAVEHLDHAGEFLSKRLGLGLDTTTQLVPHDAMFPPLAIALAEIERRFPKSSPTKAKWASRNREMVPRFRFAPTLFFRSANYSAKRHQRFAQLD